MKTTIFERMAHEQPKELVKILSTFNLLVKTQSYPPYFRLECVESKEEE